MKPGDKLWLVRKYDSGVKVHVFDVGRKWAKLDIQGLLLNLETMQVFNGDYHVGMAYPSEQAYREEQAIQDAWSEFQRLVARRTADGLTVEKIRDAAAWLGVGE